MMSTQPIKDALAQFDAMIDEMAQVCKTLKNESEGSSNTDAAVSTKEPVTETAPTPDATTNHFTNFNVQELGESLAKMEGVFVLATTNEDSTPDAAIFVPRLLDENHLVFFLGKNRSRSNLQRTGKAWGVYNVMHADASEKQQRYAGARLELSLVLSEGETAEEFKQATEGFEHMNPAVVVLRIERIIALG